ncbi:MAG TPA: polymer-forming cytoskeletal protein [Pyrinomonadaceae bacterium]|nr:polymer-forming cytoskeletal protein [Pyrinomonadaceae bacterium]
MIAIRISPDTQFSANAARTFSKTITALAALLLCLVAAQAQAPDDHPSDPQARVIDGVSNSTVFGLGQSIRITGTVKQGAIAFGGDVIVEGTVDGDVAAIGGSVIQREGSRIGGDVIVVGGIYYHGKSLPGRDPQSVTIMYAGYEDQLRHVMREPFTLLHPQLTPAFFGLRLLAILFWFIVSLALTAVMPNTVSRAVARLNLARVRVALIGLLGSIVIAVGVIVCLLVLPEVIGALIFILALLLVLVATLFGRVVIFAGTGQWLQRRFLPRIKSESITLLLGVTFWVAMASLPYVWPIVIAGLIEISLGLALTARYRVSWKKP